MADQMVSFTTRLPKRLYNRMLEVVAATESETSRADLVRQGLELLFAQITVCPDMVAGYKPELDKSARRKRAAQSGGGKCKTNRGEE